MFTYNSYRPSVSEEPQLHHVTDRVKKYKIPTEEEIRYLGNARSYCGYYHKLLQSCVEGEIITGNDKIYKECKNKLEDLHNCYMWREPSDEKFDDRFMKENEECLLERDTFAKCYFVQAASWDTCETSWVDLYRCRFRKEPSKLTIN